MQGMLRVRSWALSAVAVAAVLAAGCSSIGLTTDRIDYKSVQPVKPLDVPPDLSQLPRSDRYAVPDRPGVASAASAAAPAAAPVAVGGAAVVPALPNARIERAGSQRWLAVDVAPEAAYAVVKEFWPSVGLAIEREDPAAGIIETAWAENRAKLPQDIIRRTIGRVFDNLYSTGEQDKYRTRIERTAKNTSEIYISHRGMIEVYTSQAQDSTRWQPRPPDPEMEAEMLQRLALRFAPRAVQTAAVPAVSAASAPQVARLVKGPDGRNERVDVDEPFDRAWRRIGLALDRGGFTVEDRDRAKGTYFVRYLDPEYEAKQRDKQGFFSKLFGREPKIEAQQFRVQVAAAGDATRVTVLDKDGKPATGATADKILAQIDEQLR
ncbi:MAG: outer membrane protein assembly factor BamC [Burkholderiaceae bacterium]